LGFLNQGAGLQVCLDLMRLSYKILWVFLDTASPLGVNQKARIDSPSGTYDGSSAERLGEVVAAARPPPPPGVLKKRLSEFGGPPRTGIGFRCELQLPIRFFLLEHQIE